MLGCGKGVDAYGQQGSGEDEKKRKRERVPQKRSRRGKEESAVFCLWLPLLLLSANQRLPSAGAVDRPLLFLCFFVCFAFFLLQSSSPCAFLHHYRPQTFTFVQRQLSGTWCHLRRVSSGMSAVYYSHISLLRAPICVASTAISARCRSRVSDAPSGLQRESTCFHAPFLPDAALPSIL